MPGKDCGFVEIDYHSIERRMVDYYNGPRNNVVNCTGGGRVKTGVEAFLFVGDRIVIRGRSFKVNHLDGDTVVASLESVPIIGGRVCDE